MSAIQLTFSLNTVAGVASVQVLGSWDGYAGELPLSRNRKSSSSSSQTGCWTGTFQFPEGTMNPGQRFWYYYIIDGYEVCHNPSVPSIVEGSTNRSLNILDIPVAESRKPPKHSKSSKSSKHSSSREKHSRHGDKQHGSRHDRVRDGLNLHVDIPKGRPLSPSLIQSPKPIHPPHTMLANTYDHPTVEELTQRFASTVFEEDWYSTPSTPPSSAGSSLSSRSDSFSDLSSATSISDSSPGTPSQCSCERYGITRRGDRVKLDCGGTRCGYADDSASCCSDESEVPFTRPLKAVSVNHDKTRESRQQAPLHHEKTRESSRKHSSPTKSSRHESTSRHKSSRHAEPRSRR